MSEIKTPEQVAEELNKSIATFKEQVEKSATKEEVDAIKTAFDTFKNEQGAKLEGLATAESLKTLEEAMVKQGETLQAIKTGGATFVETVSKQVGDFLTTNAEKLVEMFNNKSTDQIKLTVKVPENITTANATTPDGIPVLQGVQVAPPSNVNLRSSGVWDMTTNVPTNQASYAYTETVPKDGDYAFVAEGAIKPQIDFTIETRYAAPKLIAAWQKLTLQSVQDIPSLQSIATNLLFQKHNRKREKAILTGDGVGENAKGAFSYGRTFVAGSLATAVTNPNFMDVINACITDIYVTHNYEDEMNFMANTVLINPADFFINLVSAKDGDGKPLYPTATLFGRVQIGGVTIMPDEDVPVGKIFVADMSKYNTTNYMDYTVVIGRINDDLIKNQFVILGESRFHAFVKKLDEQAFIYDDIATIKTAITAA